MEQQYGTLGGALSAEANRQLDQLAAQAPRGYGRMLAARTKEYAMNTDHLAHEHSWKIMGVAAAVGLLLGLLLNRRS